MKKFLLLALIVSCCCSRASASHYMGGEITWKCLSNGKYKFTMKCYRECNGITFNPVEVLTIANYPSIGQFTMINMHLVSQTDISPVCNPDTNFSHIVCFPYPNIPNTGAIEEWVFESDSILLTGTPPAEGWIFTYESCCRNPCTNIMGADTYGWTMKAVMYPYEGRDAFPCYDNSPTFVERPVTTACAGSPASYSVCAGDSELDSLTYDWAPPLDYTTTPGPPITAYNAGYSYTSPLPGTTHNSLNVPAQLNSATGEISFTSFTQGAFVVNNKISAWKCGVKVAEVYREMQMLISNCGNNVPPSIQPPFINPVSGTFEWFADTVFAGDLVTFTMNATDFGKLPDSSFQTVSYTATGIEFGDGDTSATTGCLIPPCATLSPPPYSAQYGVSSVFNWQTHCDHVIGSHPPTCGNVSGTHYKFYFGASDDFCPIPGKSNYIVSVFVKSFPPQLEEPFLDSIAVAQNGDVTLFWINPADPYSSFNGCFIYSATSYIGPFQLIDSVMSYTTTSYTHVNAGANLTPRYYYLKSRSGCSGWMLSNPSDTAFASTVSVEEYPRSQSLKFFPNPAENEGWLSLEPWDNTPAEAVMTDVTGRIILRKTLTEKETHINLSEVKSGYYLLSVYRKGAQTGTLPVIIR